MTLRAIVTGGISGLGLATAERLRADGTEVVTLDRAPGADVVVDVADDAAVAAAVAELGAIDILINSAGVVGPNQPLWEVSTQDWDRTFAVNVRGTFHMCRAVVPGMRERGWGRIVNVSSIAGKDGNPNLQSRRNRTHQVARQGARDQRSPGERDRPCRHRNPDERGYSA
jgi:NAD(P)-dependent dehydrogenase (short-subunit alcohol dehydrogenase family)